MPEAQRRNNSGGDRQGTLHSSSDGQFGQLRRMPESLAAEAAVLGSMIVDPVCIGDVVEKLTHDQAINHLTAMVLVEIHQGRIDVLMFNPIE